MLQIYSSPCFFFIFFSGKSVILVMFAGAIILLQLRKGKCKMVTTKQKTIIYVVLLLVVLAGVIAAGTAYTRQEVVARVDGEPISKEELYDAMVKQYGPTELNYLISKKIIELEAEKQKVEVAEADLDKRIEELTESYGGKEAFNEMLAANGLTLEDVKKDLAVNVKVEKLLAPRISISEEEMKQYFDENKESFAQEEQVKARHILVESEDQAKEIKEQLAAGGDFAELAQKYSTDTTTKESGGELGFFERGEMVKEFSDAAFALGVGEISDPVQTEYGYHLIQVQEKKEASAANYEESKAEIKDILFDQKMQDEYSTWLQERIDEYKIENYIETSS